jgi:hypothetical protein
MILAILVALTATPATLPAALNSAKCGDVVTLAAGDYGSIVAPKTKCPAQAWLTVDASAARLTSLTIRNVAGLSWQGGTLKAPRAQPVGVTVDASTRVRVTGMNIGGPRVGISGARGDNYDFSGNRFDSVRSDGINVTIVHHVRIVGNQCVNFDPIPATYDKDGKLLVDGDHPDCVQVWSNPGTFPVHDVEIIGNTGSGYMQGIFLGRASPLGFDRITIYGNDMTVAAFNGIVGNDLRDSLIRGNTIRTVPGSRLQGGNRGLVKAWIKAIDGKGVTTCGNVVEAWPGGEGTGECR